MGSGRQRVRCDRLGNLALCKSPVCKWGGAVHRPRAPFSQESPWERPRNSLAASAQQGWLLFGSRRGHFPFPREKGSEKGSYQTLAGVGRKPDFLQKSGWKSCWRGRPQQGPDWHLVRSFWRRRGKIGSLWAGFGEPRRHLAVLLHTCRATGGGARGLQPSSYICVPRLAARLYLYSDIFLLSAGTGQ